MRNLFASIEMLGSLITERYDGEPLDAYRRRVLQTAGVLAHRDAASSDWLADRETEMAGRTGFACRLYHGENDEALLKEARSKLFTYDRMKTWSGPFVWPRYGASGEKTLYNKGAAQGSGVASLVDLEPAQLRSGRFVASPGYVLVGGTLYYLAADLERLCVRLPAGTNETVVLPLEIGTPDDGSVYHGHRIDVVDEHILTLVASDHEHTLRRTHEGYVLEGGPHGHALRELELTGPCFMALSRVNPQIGLDFVVGDALAGPVSEIQYAPRTTTIDGFLGVPALSTPGIEVTTDDGLHSGWIDPYSYYSGRFTLGTAPSDPNAHTHTVRTSDDGTHLLLEPTTPDEHTHTLELPEVPQARLVLPVPSEDPIAEHPFLVRTREEYGYTIVSSEFGLAPEGEEGQLVMAFDRGRLLELPVPDVPRTYIFGLGEELPASRIHTIGHRRPHPAPCEPIELHLRSEDSATGGVPAVQFRIEVRYYLQGRLIERGTYAGPFATGADAEAQVTIPTDCSLLYDSLHFRYELLTREGWQEAGTYQLSIRSSESAAPSLPYPIRPTSGARDAKHDPTTFVWRSVPGAAEYVFELSTESDFDVLLESRVTTGTSLRFTLSLNTHYYWRVKARGVHLESGWARSDFYTLDPPEAPTLIEPDDGGVVDDPPDA